MRDFMILDEIEEAVGKRLPQVYKDLVLTIDDFEYIDGISSIKSKSKIPWFFWGVERLEEDVAIEGALNRKAWNVLASFVEIDKKFHKRLSAPSSNAAIALDHLNKAVTIAEENGDYLYFDSLSDFSLWMYFHDSGETQKVAETFDEWLRSAERDS